jgi:uracil-DNA glycosylase family 4
VIRDPSCRLCRLGQREGVINRCVPGKGSGHIMLIGEAPGASEDEQGIPFVGRAGRYLDRILEQVGLTGQVYITNICKCRPQGNRGPKADEMDCCAGAYLMQELQEIKPRVVVALGLVAMSMFFPNGRAKRNQVSVSLEVGGPWTVIPTYHPSFAMQWGHREVILEALKLAKETADGTSTLGQA